MTQKKSRKSKWHATKAFSIFKNLENIKEIDNFPYRSHVLQLNQDQIINLNNL